MARKGYVWGTKRKIMIYKYKHEIEEKIDGVINLDWKTEIRID